MKQSISKSGKKSIAAIADIMSTEYKTIRILKANISQISYNSALAVLGEWIEDESPARTVVAANVHLVTEATLNPEYAATIADADLVTADGMPLVWASRLLGGTIRDRCYGPTLMERTLSHFQDSAVTHFFYGSTPATLEKLQQEVKKRWPLVKIVGAISPPFGDFNREDDLKNIDIINASGADFVWIGMGCPKQERWMQLYRRNLKADVILAVGAAFDFIAGTVSQAPPTFQRLGLEWLYRFAMEPKRLWKRYLFRNPYFMALFTMQYLNYLITGRHKKQPQ